MTLPTHTQLGCDQSALTSLNGHISTDMSTDRSVEWNSEMGDDEVSLGEEDGMGRQ